jgi:GNAT superfamily N-acetyltransferase
MSMIRDFAPGDEPAIRGLASRLQIGTAGWRSRDAVSAAIDGWIGESLDRARRDPAQLKVALQDGVVVGFITLEERHHWSGDREAYIGELVVGANQEGRGIGSALVREARCWAWGRGCSRLSLTTGARNDRARAFYAHLGFLEEDITLSAHLDA